MADENQMIHGYAQEVQFGELQYNQIYLDTDVGTGGGFNGYESKKLSQFMLRDYLAYVLKQNLHAYSTVQQSATLINAPNLVSWSTLNYSNGYQLGTNVITYPQGYGPHRVSLSFSIARLAGGSAAVVDFWLRINGIAVVASNRHATVNSNNGYYTVELEWTLQFGYGDTLQVMWQTTDQNVYLNAQPASGGMPVSPSATISIEKL